METRRSLGSQNKVKVAGAWLKRRISRIATCLQSRGRKQFRSLNHSIVKRDN
jgi:hypothetical protein